MDAARTVQALSALAHEHRLAIYRLLVERGPDGVPAGAIAEQLGVLPSSLTFHLQHLLRAGLVTQRRSSRQLIYAADFTAMNALVGFLTENCCGRGNPARPETGVNDSTRPAAARPASCRSTPPPASTVACCINEAEAEAVGKADCGCGPDCAVISGSG